MCGCGSLLGLFFSPSACWTGVDGEAVEGGGGGGGEGTEGEGRSGLGKVVDATVAPPPPSNVSGGLLGSFRVSAGEGTLFLSRDDEELVSAPSPSFSFSSLSSLDPRLLWHCPWLEGFIFHTRRAEAELTEKMKTFKTHKHKPESTPQTPLALCYCCCVTADPVVTSRSVRIQAIKC